MTFATFYWLFCLILNRFDFNWYLEKMAHCLEEEGTNPAQVPNAVAVEEQRLLNLALGQSQNDRTAEDSILQQAMLESFRANNNTQPSTNATGISADEEMQRAIQMSMQSQPANTVEIGTDLQRAVQLSMSGMNINDICAVSVAKQDLISRQNQREDPNSNPISMPDVISNPISNPDSNAVSSPNMQSSVEVQSQPVDPSDIDEKELYELLPPNPGRLREEMKTEVFCNRLRESQQIKQQILESEQRLRTLKESLSAFDDITEKNKSMTAWNTFLTKWRRWNIDGFHHYLIRIEKGKYKESVQDKAAFIQKWKRIVTEDNGDRFNNNDTFYGHYLNQFESEDLQDLGIGNRVDRRRIMSHLRALTSDQFEGIL